MLHIFSKQGLLSTAFGVVRWCVASLKKQTQEWGGRFKQQMEQQKFGWRLSWGRMWFFVGGAGYVLSFCLQLDLRFGFPIYGLKSKNPNQVVGLWVGNLFRTAFKCNCDEVSTHRRMSHRNVGELRPWELQYQSPCSKDDVFRGESWYLGYGKKTQPIGSMGLV